MSKIATAKQTGQGGTSFEDKVVAYYLACMLSETLPFDPQSGLIKNMSLQVRADGWLFDDILLTLESSQELRRIAVSVKSNQQFNSKGCPSEINRLIWEQFLHHNTPVFNKDSDSLCLVEAPIAGDVTDAINKLLQQAMRQDAATLHRRILTDGFVSKTSRELYKSFYCPTDLATQYAVDESDTVNLLKSFFEQQMDFENRVSKDETRAIELCRDALRNKSQTEAEKLFRALCFLPRTLSPVAGSIDRKGLVQTLKNDFDLAEAPRYEADWKKIKQAAGNKFLIIPDKLGDKVILDRTTLIKDIENKLAGGKGLIIQGISGSGKTNLAKLFAEKKQQEGCTIIWLDSLDFDSESLEAELRLDNPLSELVEQSSTARSYLFIDGAERLYHDRQHQRLAIILQKAAAATSPWQIIFTCPSDYLEKLNHFFTRFNFAGSAFQSFEMPELTAKQLLNIATLYPLLKEILFTDSMEKIRNNLKLLDKLIRNASNLSSLSSTQNLGESHLIDFVWSEEIEKASHGIQSNAFLKLLAELQADNLSIGVSMSLFTPEKLAPADTLRSMGFLKLLNEKLYFNHDLYGDWARYKLLKSYGIKLPDFLKQKHLTSPLWAKAVRLYGISLLEQEPTGKRWQEVFQSFTDGSPGHLLIQDLLLEAFFFAPNSYSLLKLHCELLVANNAALLKRITGLFLLRATHAAPQVLELAKQIGITEKEAAAYGRLPIPEYWPGMIKFLSEESEKAMEHDMIRVVEIATIWLEKTPEKFPFRHEVGNLSLKAAEKIVALRETGVFISEEIEDCIFKALLLGYQENPVLVGQLCLRICKRIHIKPGVEVVVNNASEPSTARLGGREVARKKTEPWPLGPLDRVDDSFRKACLDGRSMLPILQHAPALSSEILLAILIEEPKESWYHSDRLDEHYEIVEAYGWYPPFYLRGPFLNFLRFSTIEALSFICQLTDFATERWLDGQGENFASSKFEVIIHGKPKEYIGDFYVFGWHKDVGNASHSLVSVLMALEQFFYEELEANKDIEEFVAYLVNKTKSLAIIGLLFTIAKWRFTLFLTHLKPFLAEHQFYHWDLQGGYHNLTRVGDFSQPWHESVKKWMERPHRKNDVRSIICHLLLNNEVFRHDFISVRKKWEIDLAEMQSRNEIDIFFYQLIHQTNPANYERKESDQGVYFEYQEPAEVTSFLAEGRKNSLETLQDSHMAYKCQMMIDQQLPFDLAGADYLWNKFQTDYLKIDVESDSHCSGAHAWASPYTNILAAVKVLIYHKDIWIAQHPEYWTSMHQLIERLIDKQFAWGGKFEHYGTHHDWNILLAEIVPVLWKENTGSEVARKMVAGILLLFNQSTIKSFFVAASSLFSWNNPDFIQAQNLLLLYSGDYYRAVNADNGETKKLKEIRVKLTEKFSRGEIISTIINWSDIRTSEEWQLKETDHWNRRVSDSVRKPGLSTHMIKPMIETLPAIATLEDMATKEYVVLLLEQAYNQVIYQLGEVREDSVVIKSLESDFDRAVLRKVAESILYLPDDREEKCFWEPLFKFGYIAQKSIQTFCNIFFVNLDHPNVRGKMAKLLNEMVEYTYISSTWATKHIDRFSDFRICVMGFHSWMRDVWKHDYSAFTSIAEPIYKKWFNKKQWNPYVIDSLLGFITTPSGKFMLKDGLRILASFFRLSLHQSQQKAPEGTVWVGHKDLDDKLATCLSALWQYFSGDIKADKESYIFYRELIQYLIAMKSIVGIELQNALVQE